MILFIVGFIGYIRVWVESDAQETTIDLRPLLPAAIARAVIALCGLTILCWLLAISLWAIVAILLGVGCLLALVNEASDVREGAGPLFAAVVVLREWCFGFPELILHPPTDPGDAIGLNEEACIGRHGTVVSPLRPNGHITVAGQRLSAVSDTGELLQNGTQIIVCGFQNGRPRVRLREDGDVEVTHGHT
ncbi:MAG: NfeD family protein [Planctomycetota bacterium]